MKINFVKAANIVGTGLGIVGTLLTAYASKKFAEETIAKQVVEEVTKQLNK